MDKYIGRLLDNRYEILEVIGTGGMAVVYKARCHRLNRLVAVKILKDEYMEDEEFRRRFRSESQAVAMLSHPNIVSVYDVSTSITAEYIVMELIDGITLKQYMEKKGVLNWKETLHFAIQIGKALEHAHGRGIVHRDIKPHNVMVLKNGSVKVTDFGIARVMSQSNTLTKEALGSVHYISPEQAKGGRVDSRSDIYSLGVVMYEMMSGRPPYDGESPVAVAIKHINGGAVMPSTLNPNIPGGLEQIIMHAMAMEPEERYESATAMLRDMDEFRKDPGMLFDYNTPPLEDVIRIQKPPLVLDPEPKKTIAEKVENKQHRSTNGGTPNRRTAAAPKKPTRRRDVREEQRNNVATIAIISCSAVMVLAIVIFLVVLFSDGTGPKPQLIDVPQLIGQDYETLQSSGDYQVKLNEKVHDSNYPAGQIIDQKPAFGTQMNKGDTIYVTVSLGEVPEVVKMPNVVDWELSQAERALNNLGINLQIKVDRENHDEVPEGRVIRTEPMAETELTTSQEVTLVVSLGMEFKTSAMPDVIGYEKNDAKKVLDDQQLALEITVEEIYDSNVPAGCVVKTSPEADEELTTGDEVTLYVSKGAQLLPMSAVLNLKVDSAVNILKSDGFSHYTIETVEDIKQKDTVIEIRVDGVTVQPGDKVDAGKTVTLVVSLGQTQTRDKKVVIQLPEDYLEAYTLSVYLGGDKVYEVAIPEDYESSSIEITLTGSGIETMKVYTDGSLYYETKVDFTQ